MDKNYWREYYKLHGDPTQSSLFARFVLKEHAKEDEKMIELGCGNGRDSVFFAGHGVEVTSIDQCENEISLLVEKNKFPNLKFICGNFTKLDELGPFDHVYSRFTLHSISEKEEDAVIKWAHKNLKKGGKLLIEARGKKNEFYKLGEPVPGEQNAYIYESHYRRFIDIDELKNKLTVIGFKIIMAEEKAGFAPSNRPNQANQKFIRIIASKE